MVSSRPSLTTSRTSRGTTSMPTASSADQEGRQLADGPGQRARPTARRPRPAAVSTASSRMAIRSSTIRMPKTSSATLPLTFCSSNALTMMVVLEMAIIAPANRLSSAVQPNSRAGDVAEPDHQAALDDRHEPGGGADPDQLAQAELQPQREHQQDHAELGELMGHAGVGEQRDRHVGPDDQAGQQVAEHHRLLEPLEQDGGDRGHAQDGRQVRQHADRPSARGRHGGEEARQEGHPETMTILATLRNDADAASGARGRVRERARVRARGRGRGRVRARVRVRVRVGPEAVGSRMAARGR